MTARERMVAGEPLRRARSELVEARGRARLLLARYNATGDREALTALFGRLADDTVVEPPFHCDYGFNISVGRRFYAERELRLPRLRADRDRRPRPARAWRPPLTRPRTRSMRRSGAEASSSRSRSRSATTRGSEAARSCFPASPSAPARSSGPASVVTRDVSADERVAGNPARPIGR